MRIDLNADVGEGCDDEALFPFITSINVACGGHAGDEETMRKALHAARRTALAVGAHPSYPDRERFGRVDLDLPPADLARALREQIEWLRAVAAAEGIRVTHVKPHGALYNRAARDRHVADIVARAVGRIDPELAIVALCGSALVEAARAAGLRAVREAFADRRYRADGTLVPRGIEGAVIELPHAAAEQALAIVRERRLRTLEGVMLAIDADTLCIHSDTPNAARVAESVREALSTAGVEIAAL